MSYYPQPPQPPGYHPYAHKGFPHVGGTNINFQLPVSRAANRRDESYTEKRNVHNAVERKRRETLNVKFQELAHAIPALASVRRPSKSVIVQKSLDFVYAALERESKSNEEISHLRCENETYFAEVTRLRSLLDQPQLNKQQLDMSLPQPDPHKAKHKSASKAGAEPKPYDPVLDELDEISQSPEERTDIDCSDLSDTASKDQEEDDFGSFDGPYFMDSYNPHSTLDTNGYNEGDLKYPSVTGITF